MFPISGCQPGTLPWHLDKPSKDQALSAGPGTCLVSIAGLPLQHCSLSYSQLFQALLTRRGQFDFLSNKLKKQIIQLMEEAECKSVSKGLGKPRRAAGTSLVGCLPPKKSTQKPLVSTVGTAVWPALWTPQSSGLWHITGAPSQYSKALYAMQTCRHTDPQLI